MTKNCKHLPVACIAAQECGGKGIVRFGLALSLLSLVRWFNLVILFFHLALKQSLEFKPPEQVFNSDVPLRCVEMSCEVYSDFLPIIKVQKCAREATMVFKMRIVKTWISKNSSSFQNSQSSP